MNFVTVHAEILSNNKSLGTWLFSRAIEQTQLIEIENKRYEFILRPVRYYTSYDLTLKDFRHDIYPGTDIPKNFSSLVHLNDPEKQEDRDVLIYMNHPLRYRGKTYYQASFGKDDGCPTRVQVIYSTSRTRGVGHRDENGARVNT